MKHNILKLVNFTQLLDLENNCIFAAYDTCTLNMSRDAGKQVFGIFNQV